MWLVCWPSCIIVIYLYFYIKLSYEPNTFYEYESKNMMHQQDNYDHLLVWRRTTIAEQFYSNKNMVKYWCGDTSNNWLRAVTWGSTLLNCGQKLCEVSNILEYIMCHTDTPATYYSPLCITGYNKVTNVEVFECCVVFTGVNVTTELYCC